MPSSVAGGDRLRLFVALRLPPPALDALVRWQAETLASVRRVRVVPRENLHVTLAFLGGRPADDVAAIVAAMRDSAGEVGTPVLTPSRYRETRGVGMVVFEDEGQRAGGLATRLFARLERLGVYERERRRWLPHVTVLRFRSPPRLRPAVPHLGAVSPSDAAVYSSVLRPTGAQYEVLESVGWKEH